MNKLIINIGRQFGSGGKGVANEIGKKLGIPVYDNELIAKAAEKSGFSSGLLSKSDEKRGGFPNPSAFASLSFGAVQNYLNDEAMFRIQSKVIEDIAEAESAVIIGRCANYILRNRDCTLNVFITCPIFKRIERVCSRTGLSPEKAGEEIAKHDRERERYYNYFTFGNWGAASDYDLCIDSSVLGIEKTAEYIIEFAKSLMEAGCK